MNKHTIKVNGATVSIIGDVANEEAYISLTDYKGVKYERYIITITTIRQRAIHTG